MITIRPSATHALIGSPIYHSKSPEIYMRFAEVSSIKNMNYVLLEASSNNFFSKIQDFISEGGKGINVTTPFKVEAYALASKLTARAQVAGAVNLLTFNNGLILGDNTDGLGLKNDLIKNANFDWTHKKILLLGAGGAARGVLLPLLERCPLKLTIANRTMTKAYELAKIFWPYRGDCELNVCSLSDVSSQYDLVINATSTSLHADSIPLKPSIFSSETLAYDMMYGSYPTVFMQFAASQGALVRDGLGMLIEQASEAFFVWHSIRPNTSSIFSALQVQA